MKIIFSWIWNILKSIWLFFEKYGITIIAICSAIVCIVTIVLDVILFFRKLKEDKNLSYAKLLEEVYHDLESLKTEEEKDSESSEDIPF